MKHTIFLVLVLVLCLFYQNCISPIAQPLAIKNKERDTQAILDKIFTTAEGHSISFNKASSTLQAKVQVLDKIYDGIPVNVDEGVKLTELASLEEKIQQKRIQITFEQEKPTSVTLRKTWLLDKKDEHTPNEAIVFCGNPGVGKSALCNSIFQELKFPSGTSRGQGLTTHHQTHMYKNRLYIDTPGLEDISMRGQAAAEIEQALKKGGNYKIVFVIKLDGGRLRQADLNSINVVCDAIRTPFEYGLVINQSKQKTINKIIEEGGLGSYLRITLHKQPCQTIMLTKDKRMDEENDVYLEEGENRNKLLDLINNLPATNIQLGKLDTQNFEEKIQQMEEKHTKAMSEQEAKHKQEREEQEMRITKEIEKHETQMRKERNKQEDRIRRLQEKNEEKQQEVEAKRKKERKEQEDRIKRLQEEMEKKQRQAEAKSKRQREEQEAKIKRFQENMEEQQRVLEANREKDREEAEAKLRRIQQENEAKQRVAEAERKKEREEREAKYKKEREEAEARIKLEYLALNAPHRDIIEEALASQKKGEEGHLYLDHKNLNNNDIIFLANHPLCKTTYGKIYLNSNNIIDPNELARKLQGTQVEEIDLDSNKIGSTQAAAFVKALQGTQVKKINLGHNEIRSTQIAEIAKALRGTRVEKVDLTGNNLGDQGAAEFVKALQGTQVKKINLAYNRIGDQGVIALAKGLQSTNVREVQLFAFVLFKDRNMVNTIGKETQQLIKNQYPNIKWIFDMDSLCILS